MLAGLLVTLGCTKKENSQSKLEQVSEALPEAAIEQENRGELSEAPQFGKRRNFRVFTKGSDKGLRFYVIFSVTHREVGGVADPTRPSGPDNRKIKGFEEVGVYAMDDTGHVITRKQLPENSISFRATQCMHP